MFIPDWLHCVIQGYCQPLKFSHLKNEIFIDIKCNALSTWTRRTFYWILKATQKIEQKIWGTSPTCMEDWLMRIGALSEYVLISINTDVGQSLGIIFTFQLEKKIPLPLWGYQFNFTQKNRDKISCSKCIFSYFLFRRVVQIWLSWTKYFYRSLVNCLPITVLLKIFCVRSSSSVSYLRTN